jgi:hypothetical protein
MTACGGGVPLLHEARTLPRGDVRMTGGVSANFPVGNASGALNAAKSDAATNPSPAPGSDATLAKGALVLAAVTPGIAPVVAARVGVGAHFEGGITYTGRALRIDMRRSFDFGRASLSVGAGMTAVFYDSKVTSEQAQLAAVDMTSLHGYGADVPVLWGWESRTGLYMVWAGARGGWEHDVISPINTAPPLMLSAGSIDEAATFFPLSADRFYGGAVAGLAGGFRHVHVALEVEAAYQTIHGTFNGNEVTVSGPSVTPAGAMWWTF